MDKAMFRSQKRGLRTPSRSEAPVITAPADDADSLCLRAGARAGSFIQASTRGSTRIIGRAARSQKAACQFHCEITALTAEGMSMAARPVPERTSARARPRLRSNHRFTRWVQVTCIVPMLAMDIRKKPR